MSAARYAVYYVPDAGDPLWAFGCETLGYDPIRGLQLASAPPPGLSPEDWQGLIAGPQRYGFHATIKAPFEPAEGLDERAIAAALDEFAARQEPFEIPPLRPILHHGHVVLVPEAASNELAELEARVVRELDHLRAPLSPADLARRLKAPLTERQRAQLEAFGYPYVLQDFRFHMTLAGPCPEPFGEAVRQALAERFRARIAHAPVAVRGLALFAEPARGDHFRLVHKAAFAQVPR